MAVPLFEELTGRIRGDDDDGTFEVDDCVLVDGDLAHIQRKRRNGTYDIRYVKDITTPCRSCLDGPIFVSTESTAFEKSYFSVVTAEM
jgi:hypothetical protein